MSAEEVKKLVDKEAYVYLILINTPEEVVIAGEPSACERVIKKLKSPIHPCLFPEANTPAEYWQNLLQGKNSCTSATEPILEAEPSRFYANKKGVADKYY